MAERNRYRCGTDKKRRTRCCQVRTVSGHRCQNKYEVDLGLANTTIARKIASLLQGKNIVNFIPSAMDEKGGTCCRICRFHVGYILRNAAIVWGLPWLVNKIFSDALKYSSINELADVIAEQRRLEDVERKYDEMMAQYQAQFM